MKYIVILGDGMADYPVAALNGRTPLQAAKKPTMDYLARKGIVGMVQTIPAGMPPGSDVANLSVMGYDTRRFYTGRSPLEAVSMGISLANSDVAVRCNLVTLSEESPYSEKTMLDYSADEVSTEESAVLMKAVQQALGDDNVAFYPGVSYRHCMIWHRGQTGLSLTPPHDIADKKIKSYLPKNPVLQNLMEKSNALLAAHPINAARIRRGLKPANAIWLWGEGTRLAIPSFQAKYNVSGAVISAVDLLKGIGISAGLEALDVPGATGNIHTDFNAKMEAAVHTLRQGRDFVYIHVEAPDECGHRNEVDNKVLAISRIDEKIIAPLMAAMEAMDPYRMLVLPDHPTPLSLRTHTDEPVPFILYDSQQERDSTVTGYDEEQARRTGVFIAAGHTLMDTLIDGKF